MEIKSFYFPVLISHGTGNTLVHLSRSNAGAL
jgi:hypothetical protein